VVVTKGTIIIRGAKMVVKQDPEGYQFGTVTADPGKQAYFRQKRDGVDEYIEGEAETIQYDGKADRVKFIGRAEMRRLRGSAVNDETSGSVITYDNANDQFTVEGGASAGGTPSNPGGRVRATLAPRGPASAPAGAASGPRASATLPAPQPAASARLRPSPTLPEAR
jgi:lipopolysaccharide export system protein LptA